MTKKLLKFLLQFLYGVLNLIFVVFCICSYGVIMFGYLGVFGIPDIQKYLRPNFPQWFWGWLYILIPICTIGFAVGWFYLLAYLGDKYEDLGSRLKDKISVLTSEINYSFHTDISDISTETHSTKIETNTVSIEKEPSLPNPITQKKISPIESKPIVKKPSTNNVIGKSERSVKIIQKPIDKVGIIDKATKFKALKKLVRKVSDSIFTVDRTEPIQQVEPVKQVRTVETVKPVTLQPIITVQEVKEPIVKDFHEIFIPKEKISIPKEGRSKISTALPNLSADDYNDALKHKQTIGMLGELFVLDLVIDELKKNKLFELAAKVDHVSVTKGDYKGFDIHSFDEFGNDKYIEVKTSTGSRTSDFFVTENEMKNIKQLNGYFIYRVFDFDVETCLGNVYIFDCKKNFADFFNIQPIQYRVSPKRK